MNEYRLSEQLKKTNERWKNFLAVKTIDSVSSCIIPRRNGINDLLSLVKNNFNSEETEFLQKIGLYSEEFDENKNYDTSQMIQKIQNAFYQINDPMLLYLIADYLYRKDIILTMGQIYYIKNKFNETNYYINNFNFDYLHGFTDPRDLSPTFSFLGLYDITYEKHSKVKLNKFQKFLCAFFDGLSQFVVSGCSSSMIFLVLCILWLAHVALGPLALGLTIGLCGSLALSSGVISALTLTDKIDIPNKLKNYFIESNKKRLLAKNKIGKLQNTQRIDPQPNNLQTAINQTAINQTEQIPESQNQPADQR